MTGRIAELSLAAVRMAAAAPWARPADLAQWLYWFGTLPRGPAIELDFGPDDDPMAVLGMTVGGRARRLLEGPFDATTHPGWYSFAFAPSPLQLRADCKLYVSPRPEALADAFPIIAETFVGSRVRSFKVGRGIDGTLRPDKIIAYFDTRMHLEEVIRALSVSLAGCPAQGVPFTAEAGGDGLLSWGVDPPTTKGVTSWRSWVTGRLAAGLTAARTASAADPLATALADLRDAGVDPDRWLPATVVLSAEASL